MAFLKQRSQAVPLVTALLCALSIKLVSVDNYPKFFPAVARGLSLEVQLSIEKKNYPKNKLFYRIFKAETYTSIK